MSDNIQTSEGSRRPGKFFVPLLLLLVTGAAARVALVLAGGRFFISDEGRHLHGLHLYYFLLRGDWDGARTVLRFSDNWGYIIVSAFTTAVQHAMSAVSSLAKWPVELASLHQTLFLGGIVLAMAPVLSVWALYRLARRLGADEREAFCGALFLSLSNTSFYFSRHLFPYDTSIALVLISLWIAAGPTGVSRSLFAGMLAGAAFHIYNAYWYLLPLVAAARWIDAGQVRRKVADFGLTLVGELLAIAVPYGWGWWTYGDSFLKSTVLYGRSVVQGLYREGWSLPWEYLWNSEGLYGVLALGLAFAMWLRLRGREPIPRRVRLVLASVIVIYGLWVGVSSWAHLFVINARTVKPVVPLLCLLSGWGLASLLRSNFRLGWAVGALIAALGVLNLVPHYFMVFPREFEAGVIAQVGNPKRTASVSGSHFSPKIPSVSAPAYLMVNAQYLYPIRSVATVPEGKTIFSAAHPLAYRPYQYDGFTPRQREILRLANLRMSLIQLADSAAVPDLPPAEFQATNADWPDGFDSEASMAGNPAGRGAR